MIDVYADMNPVVSVIMLTYNRAGFLQRSVSSFLNQTFKDAELIIIDDGSEDDTFKIAGDFIRSYKNIRYLKHSHRGISLSRNAGIKVAAGRYIAFLDSDDEYKPDYLVERVRFMKTNPDTDLIEGGAVIIGDPWVKDKTDLSKKIHLSDCHIGATFFGKAEVFNNLEGYDKDISYSEESAFWEKAEKVFKVEKFNHKGYIYYRNNQDSVCNRI